MRSISRPVNRSRMLSSAVICSVILSLASMAHGDTYDRAYDGFDTIASSLPLPGTVEVSPSDEYRVTVEGSAAVIAALDISISGTTLKLAPKLGARVSIGDATLKVLVPASSIASVGTTGAVQLVVYGAVLKTSGLIRISTSGSGKLTLNDVTAADLEINQSGSGTLIVDGSPQKIVVSASGSGNTYLIGVEVSVTLDVSGSGTTYVDGKGKSVSISGSASGVYNVEYTSGSCSVRGTAYVRAPCQQVGSISVP